MNSHKPPTPSSNKNGFFAPLVSNNELNTVLPSHFFDESYEILNTTLPTSVFPQEELASPPKPATDKNTEAQTSNMEVVIPKITINPMLVDNLISNTPFKEREKIYPKKKAASSTHKKTLEDYKKDIDRLAELKQKPTLEKSEKRECRQIKNRLYAHFRREKESKKLCDLEKKYKELTIEQEELKSKIAAIQLNNKELKQSIENWLHFFNKSPLNPPSDISKQEINSQSKFKLY